MFDLYIDLQTAVLSVLNFPIHEPSMSVRLLRTSLIFFSISMCVLSMQVFGRPCFVKFTAKYFIFELS